MKQLPKLPSERLVTPLSTVTWTGPTGEVVQVLITPANVAQVDKLFKQIIQGKHQLDLAIVLQIQKLRKRALKAIANASIQHTANVDLIKAELRNKKRSNQAKGKNYGFARVLNKETIKEQEEFYLFKDH